MRTEQMDILTKSAGNNPTVPEGEKIHFHVMQSLKFNKWVLAVVQGVFETYQVTELMSANVELMVQYADYLNKGIIGPGLDAKQIEILEQLRKKYVG